MERIVSSNIFWLWSFVSLSTFLLVTLWVIPVHGQKSPGIETSYLIKQEASSSSLLTSNLVLDHTNWMWYPDQKELNLEKVKTLKIYFNHASVGANILEGFMNLNNLNPSKYPFNIITAGDTPAAQLVPGTIFEYPRGNPGWKAKILIFENSLRNGWGASKLDLALNKFCYIDQEADWASYRDSMITLEAQYPDLRFVYWTMPLTTSSGQDETRRCDFNQNLRNWIGSQTNKVLFDIADIEAWNTAGKHQTFTFQGKTCEKLSTDYTSDGGHLNLEGSQRIANGLYSLIYLATVEIPKEVSPTVNPTYSGISSVPSSITPNDTSSVSPSPTLSENPLVTSSDMEKSRVISRTWIIGGISLVVILILGLLFGLLTRKHR